MLEKRVFVRSEHLPLLVTTLRSKFTEMQVPVAAIACHPTHSHALIKVGDEDAKPIFGRAKQASSHAVRSHYPGRLWEGSSGVRRIRDFRHFASALWYILDHERQRAAVWFEPEMEQSCRLRYPDYRDKYEYSLDGPEDS